MTRYQCIRKCYAYGKKWKVGDVLEASVVPNHHFMQIEGAASPVINLVPTQLKAPTKDIMKPVGNGTQPGSFSQMQGGGNPIKHGMAACLGELNPIISPREMVTR